MSHQSEQLVREAELLLELYNDPSAQRRRLQRIEQQLRAEGVYSAALHHRIESICSESDPAAFRCRYGLPSL